MEKLIGFVVMLAGAHEFMGLFTITSDIDLLAKIKNVKDWPEYSKMTEDQKSLMVRCLWKWLMCMLELFALLLGCLMLPTPLKWALLFVAIPLPAISFAISKFLPRPLLIAWRFLDNAFCTIIMIGGPVYFLR